MFNHCYHCGAKTQGAAICPKCRFDMNPVPDVYCNQQTCDDYDCGADVPRWSRFCPICGKSIWQYDPQNIEYKAQRHKGLILGAFIWTIIAFVIAFVLTLVDDEIPFKITGIIAAIISVLIWSVCFTKFERGKYIDGTVVRHWVEEGQESVVLPDEKTLLGNRRFEQMNVTWYMTEVSWDNGKTDKMMMKNCVANHIQLAPSDRIRKYKSTGEFIKLYRD